MIEYVCGVEGGEREDSGICVCLYILNQEIDGILCGPCSPPHPLLLVFW
jgi:hypothetical protein